jgi:hypothetical protein
MLSQTRDPDLELGECKPSFPTTPALTLVQSASPSPTQIQTQTQTQPQLPTTSRLWGLPSACSDAARRLFRSGRAPARQLQQIEDYPEGYPRITALIASHDSFFVARRFMNLRARLLLAKQNRLVMLERRLHKLDKDETALLFLGSLEADENVERQKTISKIDEALEDYDNFVLRNHRMSGLDGAESRPIENLQNWVEGTGCISRAESAYLYQPPEELLNTQSRDDSAMVGLEANVAERLVRIRDYFFKSSRPSISRDSNVYIPRRSTTLRIARGLMTPIIVALLLAPVVLCTYLETVSSRLYVIAGSTIIFIAIMSSATRVKSSELVIAAATYATVLVVFVSDIM